MIVHWFANRNRNFGESRTSKRPLRSDTIQPDYVAWSTFSTIFLNSCCLGFIAYVYSVKSRDRKMVGDMNGAQTYASTAKKLNIIAVVISVVCFIILIILYSAGITSLSYSRHN
eukprot:XP_017445735.1 PREDICTED: interferon-induced transmembrane protein 2 isoform X2 [Rattus norvegicus]